MAWPYPIYYNKADTGVCSYPQVVLLEPLYELPIELDLLSI